MYKRTDSKYRSRGHYRGELALHNAERRKVSTQPVATEEQNELLGKWAKGVHIVGNSVLTAQEYATLAQHPAISEAARQRFTELAQA